MVLFFESEATVTDWQEKRTSVRDIFPEWSQQVTGIAQINTSTAVSGLGPGANLQHHAPMFMKEEINAMYGLPSDWRMYAELAIGSKSGRAARQGVHERRGQVRCQGIVLGVTEQRQMNGNHLYLANKSDEVQMRDLIASIHRK